VCTLFDFCLRCVFEFRVVILCGYVIVMEHYHAYLFHGDRHGKLSCLCLSMVIVMEQHHVYVPWWSSWKNIMLIFPW